MQKKLLKVNPSDNVIVALTDLSQGENLNFEGNEITTLAPVKAKHKIAEKDFAVGDSIVMYGVLVGKAFLPIKKGEVITTENVKHQSEKVTGKQTTLSWTPPNVEKWKDKTFLGYHREDGQVGTSNVWLFFPLVFCENKNIEKLKDIFARYSRFDDANGGFGIGLNIVKMICDEYSIEINVESEIKRGTKFELKWEK